MTKVLQPGGWRVSAALFRSGSTLNLGLKKSYSSIPLKAYGKGPTVGRIDYEPLCKGG
jgi:hypothetical protein